MKEVPIFVRDHHNRYYTNPGLHEHPTYQKLIAAGHPAAGYLKLRQFFDCLPWAAGSDCRYVMAADGLGVVVMQSPRLLVARKTPPGKCLDFAIDELAMDPASEDFWGEYDGTARCLWTIEIAAVRKDLQSGLSHLHWWRLRERMVSGFHQSWFDLPYEGSNDIARWLLHEDVLQNNLLVAESELATFIQGISCSAYKTSSTLAMEPDRFDAWL